MEIKSFTIYDRDNGFECVTDTESLYLQLPDTPDSRHSILDGAYDEDLSEEENEFVSRVIAQLKEKYTNTDFCCFQLLNSICDYTIKYCENWKYSDYCVIVEDGNPDNYVFAERASGISDYYNTTLINRADEDEMSYDPEIEKHLEKTLAEILRKNQ